MTRLSLYIYALTCFMCVRLGTQCKPGPGWVPQDWSMVPLFSAAPYVVYVEGVGRDETRNIATFKVHCVLKTPAGKDIPEEIYVSHVVSQLSCKTNPEYEVGEFYLTALEEEGVYTPDSALYPLAQIYANYKPDIFTTRNLHVATEGENIDTAFNVCGLSATPKAGSCPAFTEASDCISPAPTKTTTTFLPILSNAPAISLSTFLFIHSVLIHMFIMK